MERKQTRLVLKKQNDDGSPVVFNLAKERDAAREEKEVGMNQRTCDIPCCLAQPPFNGKAFRGGPNYDVVWRDCYFFIYDSKFRGDGKWAVL
jgi:hypothetical protein